jgi:hypothetical protein
VITHNLELSLRGTVFVPKQSPPSNRRLLRFARNDRLVVITRIAWIDFK